MGRAGLHLIWSFLPVNSHTQIQFLSYRYRIHMCILPLFAVSFLSWEVDFAPLCKVQGLTPPPSFTDQDADGQKAGAGASP